MGIGLEALNEYPVCSSDITKYVQMLSLSILFIRGLSVAVIFAATPAWSESLTPSSTAITANPTPEIPIEGVSEKLKIRVPDAGLRQTLLQDISSESKRARISPFLVLSIIDVASGFEKHAVSDNGARGYMQIMPYWVKVIGKPEHNLFHMKTNLRYGCTLMKGYIEEENGDLRRALVKYRAANSAPQSPQENADEFADTVLNRMNSWQLSAHQ